MIFFEEEETFLLWIRGLIKLGVVLFFQLLYSSGGVCSDIGHFVVVRTLYCVSTYSLFNIPLLREARSFEKNLIFLLAMEELLHFRDDEELRPLFSETREPHTKFGKKYLFHSNYEKCSENSLPHHCSFAYVSLCVRRWVN